MYSSSNNSIILPQIDGGEKDKNQHQKDIWKSLKKFFDHKLPITPSIKTKENKYIVYHELFPLKYEKGIIKPIVQYP